MPFLPLKGDTMEKHKVGDIVEINGVTRIITAVKADSFISTIYDPDIPVVTKRKTEDKPEEEKKIKKTTTRKRG